MKMHKNNFGVSFGWYLCAAQRFSQRFRQPTQLFDVDDDDDDDDSSDSIYCKRTPTSEF